MPIIARFFYGLLAIMLGGFFAATCAASTLGLRTEIQPDNAAAGPASVIEFYNTGLDNYFITADAGEAAAIDNGSAGPGWSRTGNNFKSGGSTPVCRFYGSQSPGPNSHFYTVDPVECASLKQLQASTPATQKRWNFESLDFTSTAPLNGSCASGTVPIYRAYNNGFARGVDSNHRISSNLAAIQLVGARGWINEGVVMCAPTDSSTSTTVAVTFDPLMYGRNAVFAVTGPNLVQGLTLLSPGCNNLAESAGGSATLRMFTCTPVTTGVMPVSVKGADGSILLSVNPIVPLPQVIFKTTLGDIRLELYPANAPVTVGNFLQYVKDDFFKGKIFHRVIDNFVIQAGGYDAAMQEAITRSAIRLEMPNGLSNVRGTIAMARTSVPDSATSQFFINVVDNINLDTVGGGYAVFGKVINGMEVVDLIKLVPTHISNGMPDVPITPVLINAATQIQ